MNFDYLGGQQQMSGQQLGMLQSLQQPGTNEAQLMQQQVMSKQMQELQSRHQLQQLKAMQRNPVNHMATFPNQAGGQQSQTINDNPVQDKSNFLWQSHITTGGANWQAYSDRPEQSQAMSFRDSSPQQTFPSLYGVPVSNTGGTNLFPQKSMDKLGDVHLPAPSGSFIGKPYSPCTQQFSLQDASISSKSGCDGKTSSEHGSTQGAHNTVHLRGFDQVQQLKLSMLDSGGRDGIGAAASQPTSQATVGLDPTEEKILFGDDANIWEAFGGSLVEGDDGAYLFNGLPSNPSLQSGTWSALMQSAVAESSSIDVGMQEEWSCLESRNSRSHSGNQPPSISQDNDNDKPPPVWDGSSQRASLGFRTTVNDVDASNVTLSTNSSHISISQQVFSDHISSPTESRALPEGKRWLDSNFPKPHTEEKQVLENQNFPTSLSKIDTGFPSHRQCSFLPKSDPDSKINSMVDSIESVLININLSNESSQRAHDHHSLDFSKSVDFTTKSGIVGLGNDQLYMNKGQSLLDRSVNSSSGRVTEGRENSSDGHQNSLPNHALAGWPDVGNQHCLPSPLEISYGYAGKRVPVAQKFQHHLMGNVDVEESSVKQVSHTDSLTNSARLRNPIENQYAIAVAGQMMGDLQSSNVSSDRHAYHDQQSTTYPNLMQAMKIMDMDLSHRESQMLRCSENGPDASHMSGKVPGPLTGGVNSVVIYPLQPSGSQTSVSLGDAMRSFSPQSGNIDTSSQSLHGAVASHDMASLGYNVSQTYVTGNISSRPQLTGISPQMASSWFEQLGAFRNGRLLPVHDMPRISTVKNVENQFIEPPRNMIVQNLVQLENAVPSSPVPMRPRKRKTATSDLMPWNKEIGQYFKKIQNISSAEVDWAQSLKCLVERGDETDFHEEVSLIVRPRRRLILTSKLMQQIFHPPSASILSLDGRSNYETIVYSIARLALGDACSLICNLKSSSSPDIGNSKVKTSETICDLYFSKIMEDFTDRAKLLENEILRLDKCASSLDLRLDCHDLEKFALINHFVKFHGRSQVDRVETSPSSDTRARSLKSCPKTYVTAHPMPRTVPERVQCLTIN